VTGGAIRGTVLRRNKPRAVGGTGAGRIARSGSQSESRIVTKRAPGAASWQFAIVRRPAGGPSGRNLTLGTQGEWPRTTRPGRSLGAPERRGSTLRGRNRPRNWTPQLRLALDFPRSRAYRGVPRASYGCHAGSGAAALKAIVPCANAHSKPFRWVADPHEIIAAVRHRHEALFATPGPLWHPE
jgi:hypothetical protein